MSKAIHKRHTDAGGGLCACCGKGVPCPARRHARAVIAAAGDNPPSYGKLSDDTVELRALSGRRAELDAEALLYEREQH